MENIKEAVDEFLSKNQEEFEIINEFEDKIVDLNKDSFQEMIQFIKDHKNVFFKDHASIISFIQIIERALVFNFQKFEVILDIILNFPTEIRNHNITDYEILEILGCYQVSHNYLFAHNFFSVETITNYSYINDLFFIKFLPEIEQYDSEYCKLRESRLEISHKNNRFKELYNLVKTDPNRHIINRTTCYHPSSLHKCIRDDDIDTFQSLLSKNNYTINDRIPYSYYERAQTIDSNLSLIQIAATYSSIKIFKFLWMQNGIEIPDNLLQYAFFGRNNEIIHLCENKTSHDKVILQAIFMNRLDLLDYYLENFADKHIEKNSLVIEKLNEFRKSEDDKDLYDLLTFEDLSAGISYFVIPILQSCLYKIVFLFRKFDCENVSINDKYMIESSLIHFKLFEFIYSQKVVDFEKTLCFSHCLKNAVLSIGNDAFKFLYSKGFLDVDVYDIFLFCLEYNIEMANYVLDFQIDFQSKKEKVKKGEKVEKGENDEKDEKDENDEKDDSYSYSYEEEDEDDGDLSKYLSIDLLIDVIHYCFNEDIISKMIQIANFFDDDIDNKIGVFIDELEKVASSRMMIPLFDKIMAVLPKDVLLKMVDVLEMKKHLVVANYIKSKLDTM